MLLLENMEMAGDPSAGSQVAPQISDHRPLCRVGAGDKAALALLAMGMAGFLAIERCEGLEVDCRACDG